MLAMSSPLPLTDKAGACPTAGSRSVGMHLWLAGKVDACLTVVACSVGENFWLAERVDTCLTPVACSVGMHLWLAGRNLSGVTGSAGPRPRRAASLPLEGARSLASSCACGVASQTAVALFDRSSCRSGFGAGCLDSKNLLA